MPRKPKLSEEERRELANSKRAVGVSDYAPPSPLEEDPDSLISKTSTTLEEQEALRALTFDTVDLAELEERIGIVARIVLEHYLRKPNMLGAKDKCDVALRAITTLEGSRQEVTWRDERLKKPKKVTMTAFKAEKEKAAEKLLKVAMRKKEIELKQAEMALEEIERQHGAVDPGEVN